MMLLLRFLFHITSHRRPRQPFITSRKCVINDADAAKETAIIDKDLLGEKTASPSINLCNRVREKLKRYEAKESSNRTEKSKVTVATIKAYNESAVTKMPSSKEALRKYLRHERIYQMMMAGELSDSNTLFPYVDHFRSHRQREIERLSALVDGHERLDGITSAKYNEEYLNEYFA